MRTKKYAQTESLSARGESKMDARWGKIIFLAVTAIAVLIAGVVVVGYASNAGKGWPVIPVIPLLIAATVWLGGWAFRNFLVPR